MSATNGYHFIPRNRTWPVATLAALLAFALVGCEGLDAEFDFDEGNGTSREITIAVDAGDVVAVAPRRVELRVPVVGSFHAVHQAALALDEAGIVMRLGPDDGAADGGALPLGTWVERGDVLIQLQNRALRQQFARSQGQFDTLHFRLFGNGSRALPDPDAELQVARRHAETEYERLRELAGQRAISQSRLDAAEHTYAQARAAYEGALKQLDALEAEHALLTERVESLAVRAPFPGRVASVHVEVGEHVPAGGKVVTLIDDSRLDFVFRMPEVYAPHLRLGHSSVVPNLAEFGVEGLVVSEFSPSVDPASRTVTARARLTNPARESGRPDERHAPRAISAGRFTNATVRLDVPGMFVPAAAVRLQDGRDMLYVIDREDRVEQRFVRRGVQGEGYVQVLTNLEPNERVLTRGLAALQSGTRVEILGEDERSVAAP